MTLATPSGPLHRALSLSVLADHCKREINQYRCGEPYTTEQYCVELFRRAIVQRDPLAREVTQQHFTETVLRWIQAHPQRELACRLDSEENYVAQAFARFWLATVSTKVEFQTLAAALRYLRASLNGALLERLRTSSCPKEVPLPEPGEPGEAWMEDHDEAQEVWQAIKRVLADRRDQRIAYLLFHCGLTPTDIASSCPEEFLDVQEIYRLQRTIMERLLGHTDALRWRLRTGREGEQEGR